MTPMGNFFPELPNDSTTPRKLTRASSIFREKSQALVFTSHRTVTFIWASGWTIIFMARGSISNLIIKDMKVRWPKGSWKERGSTIIWMVGFTKGNGEGELNRVMVSRKEMTHIKGNGSIIENVELEK